MGKWKCLWCSKVIEGESFMDLIDASMQEESRQHIHGWENITLVEEEGDLADKLLPNLHAWPTTNFYDWVSGNKLHSRKVLILIRPLSPPEWTTEYLGRLLDYHTFVNCTRPGSWTLDWYYSFSICIQLNMLMHIIVHIYLFAFLVSFVIFKRTFKNIVWSRYNIRTFQAK